MKPLYSQSGFFVSEYCVIRSEFRVQMPDYSSVTLDYRIKQT